jgi:mono/diheme cytochrome c family protein
MTRAIRPWVALAALALLSTDIIATGWNPWRPWGQGLPADPAQIALGHRVYQAHCASCHGVNLEGQPDWQRRRPDGRLPAPPHDPGGHTWHHPDAQLVEITRDGFARIMPGYETDMPAFGGILSEDEIIAVIAYIRSTWPPEIQRRRAERLGS